MTDFRALCAKMAEDIRYLSECLRNPDDGHDPVCLSECESDYQEARAALAQPAPPVEGDVAELEAELRGLADYFSGEGYSAEWINLLTDTADLLGQRYPAPVAEPVIVRFEFEVLDEHDQTVAGGDTSTLEEAVCEGRHYLSQYQQDGPHTLELRRVEVLNLDALPFLAGEGE